MGRDSGKPRGPSATQLHERTLTLGDSGWEPVLADDNPVVQAAWERARDLDEKLIWLNHHERKMLRDGIISLLDTTLTSPQAINDAYGVLAKL